MFQNCALAWRQKPGKSFRKKLGVMSYKFKYFNKEHKKPGVIPLNIKQKLLSRGQEGMAQIKTLEKNSHYPFGRVSRHGNFIFDQSRVPNFNVPDLTGFELKPYVSF